MGAIGACMCPRNGLDVRTIAPDCDCGMMAAGSKSGETLLLRMSARPRRAAEGKELPSSRLLASGRMARLALSGGLLMIAGGAAADAQTTIKTMPFDDCLAAKARIEAELKVEPRRVVEIVNTGAIAITRLCTPDGSVLIGCSRPGQEMVVTVRPQADPIGCLWKSLTKTPT